MSLLEYKTSKEIINIENGYFILTMFPTLKCEINCPHCYLTKEQRSGENSLSPEVFTDMLIKVKQYYLDKNITSPKIIFYWYGGEPTVLPLDYYKELIAIQKEILPKSFSIKNQFLINLQKFQPKWLQFFKNETDNYFQSSYDYLMRGENYLNNWIKNINKSVKMGFNVGAISVFNSTMINKEEIIYKQISKLNLVEIGFLPFMKNYTNLADEAKEYKKWYGNMFEFSKFLINFTKLHIEDLKQNKKTFRIGNIAHILKKQEFKHTYSNIAGQTMFFYENGDFGLPDYFDNYLDRKEIEYQDVEFVNIFKNISKNSFEDVLNSENRENFIEKQINVNNDRRCLSCEYKKLCTMEIWKSSNIDNSGECPGSYNFIEYIIEKLPKEDLEILIKNYKDIELS